jgi:hypothetical protein
MVLEPFTCRVKHVMADSLLRRVRHGVASWFRQCGELLAMERGTLVSDRRLDRGWEIRKARVPAADGP